MKTKSILYITIVVVSGLCLCIGTYNLMGGSLFRNKQPANYLTPTFSGHEGESLPNIDLLMIDSVTHFDVANIPSGTPTILIYFGPYCPYCQLVIDDVTKNIKYLKGIKFYLITSYSYAEGKSFYYKNELSKFNNIVMGVDHKFEFSKYFNTMVIPCIAVYNTDKKLNSVYLGVVKHTQMKEVSEN
jgi:hypothetical protein